MPATRRRRRTRRISSPSFNFSCTKILSSLICYYVILKPSATQANYTTAASTLPPISNHNNDTQTKTPAIWLQISSKEGPETAQNTIINLNSSNANNATSSSLFERPYDKTNLIENVIYNVIEVNGTDLDFGESRINITLEEPPPKSDHQLASPTKRSNRKRIINNSSNEEGHKLRNRKTKSTRDYKDETVSNQTMRPEVELQKPKLTQKSRKFLKEIKDKRKLRLKLINKLNEMRAATNNNKNISEAASYNHENWVSFDSSAPPSTTMEGDNSNRNEESVDFDDTNEASLEPNGAKSSSDSSNTSVNTRQNDTQARVMLSEQSSKSSEDERPVISKSTTTTTTIDDGKKKAKVVSKSAVLPAKLRQRIIEQFIRSGGDPQNIVVSDSTITTTSQSKKKTITTVYKIVPNLGSVSGKTASGVTRTGPKKIKSVVLNGDIGNEFQQNNGVNLENLNNLGGQNSLASLLDRPVRTGRGDKTLRNGPARKVKRIMVTRTEVPVMTSLGGEDLGEFYQGPHTSIFGQHNRPNDFNSEQRKLMMDLDNMVIQNGGFDDKISFQLNSNQNPPSLQQQQLNLANQQQPNLEIENGLNSQFPMGEIKLNDWLNINTKDNELSNEQVDLVDLISNTGQANLNGGQLHLSNFNEISSPQSQVMKSPKSLESSNNDKNDNKITGELTITTESGGDSKSDGLNYDSESLEGAGGRTQRKQSEQVDLVTSRRKLQTTTAGNREKKSLGPENSGSIAPEVNRTNSKRKSSLKSKASNMQHAEASGKTGKGSDGDGKLDSLEELKRVVAANQRRNGNGGQKQSQASVKNKRQPTGIAQNVTVSRETSQGRQKSTNHGELQQQPRQQQVGNQRLAPKAGDRLSVSKQGATTSNGRQQTTNSKTEANGSAQTKTPTSESHKPKQTKTHNIMMLIDFGPQPQQQQQQQQSQSQASPAKSQSTESTPTLNQESLGGGDKRLKSAASSKLSDDGTPTRKWSPTGSGNSANNWQPVQSSASKEVNPSNQPAVSVQIYNNHVGSQQGPALQRQSSSDFGQVESPFDETSMGGDDEGLSSMYDAAAASQAHQLRAPFPGYAFALPGATPSSLAFDASMGTQIPAPFQMAAASTAYQAHMDMEPPILPGESVSTNQMVRQVIDEIAMAPASASRSALAAAAASGEPQVYTTTSVHDGAIEAHEDSMSSSPSVPSGSNNQAIRSSTNDEDGATATTNDDTEVDEELLTSDQLPAPQVMAVESFADPQSSSNQQLNGNSNSGPRR